MASSSSPISLTWASTLPKQFTEQNPRTTTTTTTLPYTTYPTFSIKASSEETNPKRRQILVGVGVLALNLIPKTLASAEGKPKNYSSFVDAKDGYSYYYPSDWIDFDFRGHDSAFKDRYLALQNVRVSFIPTTKNDIHELGPMEEVIYNLTTHKFAAPTQKVTIFDMQERNVDGKNYYTFEYDLESKNYARTAFATVAIANGRYYTLIVGANERRWRRVRDQLKVVADSFKVLDI
ncbi:Photosynthetic NDH subunit of lumenal location 1 [Ranunculus cassubicifolius]